MTPIILALFTLIWLDPTGVTTSTETVANVYPSECVDFAYLLAEQEINDQIDNQVDPRGFWITCSVNGMNIYVTGQIPPGVAVPDLTIVSP